MWHLIGILHQFTIFISLAIFKRKSEQSQIYDRTGQVVNDERDQSINKKK